MNDQRSLITRTDFVFLPITSFEQAEEFYSGVLGLECSKRYDNGLGGEFENQLFEDQAFTGRIGAQCGVSARDEAQRTGKLTTRLVAASLADEIVGREGRNAEALPQDLPDSP